jgi:threonine dehydrogenase-like Zn-dependent dehydrogenase
MGATPVNLAQVDAAEAIMNATDGFGVDCGVEAVGYQAHDPAGQEHPGLVLDALVQVVRATGKIGVVGVYEPSDEGAATENAKHGRYDFDYGTAFTKGITIGSGQCPVMRYNRWLRDLIIRGQARPSQIISHEPPLDARSAATTSSTSAPTAGPRSSFTPDRRRPADRPVGGEKDLRRCAVCPGQFAPRTPQSARPQLRPVRVLPGGLGLVSAGS